jgi:transposase
MGYLTERWAQGCRNARGLYQDLVRRGYLGSESMVRLVVRPWRTRLAISPPALTPAQLARLLLQPAGRLTEAERESLENFLLANPQLAQGHQLKTRVQSLLAERNLGALEPWLQEAETSDLPSFHTRARSFRQDNDAINAALTTPWSTGQCEGQFRRFKLIKRLGYGRTTLDLLRQRVWHRMLVPVRPVKEPAAA